MRKISWQKTRRLPSAGPGRDGTALAERLIRAAPQKLAPRGWLGPGGSPPPVHQALLRSWTR